MHRNACETFPLGKRAIHHTSTDRNHHLSTVKATRSVSCRLPDGVDLAVFVHQLCAQQSSGSHLVLEAVQLVLQCLEAGGLGLAQMLLIAAHLHSSQYMAHYTAQLLCKD